MTIDTAYKGFIDDSSKVPYVIINTGDVATTENIGLDIFNSLSVGSAISYNESSSTGTSSTSLFTDKIIQNPWHDVTGFPQTIPLASINEGGVQLMVAGAETGYSIMETDGSISKTFGTPRFYNGTQGSLYIAANPSGGRATPTTRIKTDYSGGAFRMKISFGAVNTLHIQSMPDGSFFFFTTNPAINPYIGKIAPSNGMFNGIGELEPNVIYCIRASVVAVIGTVYNAAGGVAPNCSVFAFNRVTGRKVGGSRSLADGSYSLQCIASKGDQLFIVCLDDDGVAPNFNAQIIDRVMV